MIANDYLRSISRHRTDTNRLTTIEQADVVLNDLIALDIFNTTFDDSIMPDRESQADVLLIAALITFGTTREAWRGKCIDIINRYCKIKGYDNE